MDAEWMNRLCSHLYPLCPNENKRNCFYKYVGKLATRNGDWVLIVCRNIRVTGIGGFLRKGTSWQSCAGCAVGQRQVVRCWNLMQLWGVAVNLQVLKKNLSILRSLIMWFCCWFFFFFQVAIKAWYVEEFLAAAFELKLQVCGQYFYCLFCLNKWTVPSE